MEGATKPNESGLGDRPVAGDVAGRAGRAGRFGRVGMGAEMDEGGGWLALVALLGLALALAPLEWLLALPKKNVRERARRRGDFVAWAAAALLGWTGLRGGVSSAP